MALRTNISMVGATILALCLFGCATTNDVDKDQEGQGADWHYKMGANYFDAHKIPQALKALHRAVQKDSSLHRAHHLLGLIYMGRKEYSKAEKHLRKAVQLDEKFFTAKNNLGTVYLAQNRWKKALNIFRGLTREDLYGTPHLAHNNMGWAYFNMGQYQKAKKHIERAIFLNPEMCLAYNNLGRVHENLGAVEKAKEQYKRAISKCPKSYAEPHYHLGKILNNRGRSAATQHFRKCIKLSPQTSLAKRCKQYLLGYQ